MRVRRRIAFAAPFVVVLGCRRPLPEPLEEPEVRSPDAAAVIVAAIDAGIAPEPPPIDAPVAPVAIDAAVVAIDPHPDGCHDPLSHATCNPPPPDYCRDHPGQRGCPEQRTGNPPGPVLARVINVTIQSNLVVVVVNAGSDKGVTTRSTARVVTRAGVPVPGGEATLVRVTRSESVWRVKQTADAMHDNPQLRIVLDP